MLLNIDADPGSVARRLAQPSNPNAQVWRYMSFARLVWLLSKKQLWFSRADLLDDRHEAVLGSGALGTGLTARPDQPSRDEWLAELEELRSRVFVSCWHLSEHESHAMWRVYCGRQDGVAIVASYAALIAHETYRVRLPYLSPWVEIIVPPTTGLVVVVAALSFASIVSCGPSAAAVRAAFERVDLTVNSKRGLTTLDVVNGLLEPVVIDAAHGHVGGGWTVVPTRLNG